MVMATALYRALFSKIVGSDKTGIVEENVFPLSDIRIHSQPFACTSEHHNLQNCHVLTLGVVFAGVAVLELITYLLSELIFNALYSATLTILNGGFVFLVGAGLASISLLLIM